MNKKKDKISFEKCLDYLKKFWNFIWNDDSKTSYLVFILVIGIFLKFILFPTIGFFLNNDYPIVAIVSGSMEHKIVQKHPAFVGVCDKNFADSSMKGSLNLSSWWGYCGNYYENNYNLTLEQFETYPYANGLNIGDVMILYGEDPRNIDVGEVLVFIPDDERFFETKGPVIHRVVMKWEDEDGKLHFRTKGDHNPQSFSHLEQDIDETQVIAVAKVRIPFIGYAKVALFNLFSIVAHYI